MGLVGNTCIVSTLWEVNRVGKSIISLLRSRSEQPSWLLALTNKGTQILILSVLELQSSVALDVVEIDPWLLEMEELAQPELFSSLTQIFSPLIKVI